MKRGPSMLSWQTAMTPQLISVEVAVYNLVAEVFAWHCRECHNADFEVCNDPICKAVVKLEERLGGSDFWNGPGDIIMTGAFEEGS